MKIIIAGAGDVGFHLAKLLSYEEQEIILIDRDGEQLKHAASSLDVGTIRGNSTSYAILEEADVSNADLLIAVTSSEETNLTYSHYWKTSGGKKNHSPN